MSIKQKFDMLYAPILVFILALGIISHVLADTGAEVLFSSTTGECVRVVVYKDIYTTVTTSQVNTKKSGLTKI